MQTKRRLILNIRKRQLKFLGHIMRKEGLENLILTGRIEGKRDKGNQRVTFLAGLSKWMTERGLGEVAEGRDLLRAAREGWRGGGKPGWAGDGKVRKCHN